MRIRTWLLSAIPFLLLYLLPSTTFSQVSGLITSDTAWAAGTVSVSGTVTVPAGITLTINQGVTAEFAAGTSLIVAGRLVADGDNGNLIVFTSASGAPSPGDWNGIEFQNTTNIGSVFDYCVVEYAGGGTNAAGIFYKTGAFSIPVSNSTFRYSSNQGINTRSSSPSITKSTFHENAGYGIYSDLLSNFVIDSCTIVNNTAGGVHVSFNATPTITNSIIDTNGIGVFVDNSATPFIQSNNIRANSIGIQFTEVGASQPNIKFNTFDNNTNWAFQNLGTLTVLAELNYWGHDSGPYHASLNPTGLGENVTDRVDFQPWSVVAAARPVSQITASIASPTTWYADSVYWVKNDITLSSSLNIQPGTIVKLALGARLTVSGSINANGSSDSLIVFTSERDDPYGGDTNGDSTATGAASGNWDMLYLNAGGNNASVLNY
ncbi:MAG TPA: right-handed parallel beta-helix repeat-containing protein, partial [Bacteroidota bacterium]